MICERAPQSRARFGTVVAALRRRVRRPPQTILSLGHGNVSMWRYATSMSSPLGSLEGLVALVETATSAADAAPVIDKTLTWLAKPSLSVDDRLRALRTLQLAVLATPNAGPELKTRLHAALALMLLAFILRIHVH